VPDGVSPTAPEKRSWLISPLGLSQPLPIWLIFAAIVPAVLIFILLFMETQITRCVCLILCSYLLFTSQYVVRVLALESWRIGTNAPYFKSPWWMENGCGHWVILPGLARCRLRCIADCGNVCQTLKGFLVVLLALVHLRTLFCACYFLPVVDNIDGPLSMQITFAINVYFPVIVINLHMLVSNAAPSLTRKIGC